MTEATPTSAAQSIGAATTEAQPPAEGAGAVGTVTKPADAPAAPNQDWIKSFDPETQGYIQNKGWKDPAALLESYRNAEKMAGAPPEQIVRLPKEGDTEAWNAVYDKLGRPKEAAAYELPVPEGEDPGFANAAKEWFHEAGLNPQQAKLLAEKFQAYGGKLAEQQQEAQQGKLAEQHAALDKAWGLAKDQNLGIAKRAAQAFEMQAETIDKLEQAMGYDGVMQFLHKLGSKMGEDTFVSGERSGGFTMTPEAARQKIVELRNDKDFAGKLTAGSVDAKKQWDNLHKMAYPG